MMYCSLCLVFFFLLRMTKIPIDHFPAIDLKNIRAFIDSLILRLPEGVSLC